MLAEGREEAIRALVEEAEAKGANAIVAMRFDTSELGATWTEICAYGTAVRLRSSLMPRVRRQRRSEPVLELLDATLDELRHGLTQQAARTVAYELFEKLGFGAVAVTDTEAVLAFVGAGADHHGAGDRPIRPVYEAIARGRAAARAARAAHGVRGPGLPARRRSRRAAADSPTGRRVPSSRTRPPGRRSTRPPSRRSRRSDASSRRSCSCRSCRPRRRRRCRRRWSRTSSSTR